MDCRNFQNSFHITSNFFSHIESNFQSLNPYSCNCFRGREFVRGVYSTPTFFVTKHPRTSFICQYVVRGQTVFWYSVHGHGVTADKLHFQCLGLKNPDKQHFGILSEKINLQKSDFVFHFFKNASYRMCRRAHSVVLHG